MYWLTINDDSYSDVLNEELSRFVCSNTAEILTCFLEESEDAEYDIESFFPETYVNSHTRSECCQVLKTIRDRMQSYVLYDNPTLLQQYALYFAIDAWVDLLNDINPDDLHKPAPDYLKTMIIKETEETWAAEESEEDPETKVSEYIISAIEDVREYTNVFFEDTDFDSESLRGFVQCAIHNTERFLKEMSFEDLDRYIEVMPADVAEEYREFRENVSDSGLNEKALKIENSGHTTINVYGNISDSQIQVGTINSNQTINNEVFPYEEVSEVVTEIRKYRESLIQDLGEMGEQFSKAFDELSKEVYEQGNPSKIKKTLGVLKDFAIGTSGSLAASGVLALLQNINL